MQSGRRTAPKIQVDKRIWKNCSSIKDFPGFSLSTETLHQFLVIINKNWAEK